MHELSIAMSLVEAACEAVERQNALLTVRAVRLRLGPLSGVVEEALQFSFGLAAQGTAVDGARLEIERVPLVVRCPRCREDRVLEGMQSFRCPVCGTPTADVVRGKELELVALEVLDDEPAHP